MTCASAAALLKKKASRQAFMRRVGIRWLSGMIRLLCGKRVLDVTSGFRATNLAMTAYFAQHYATDYPEPEAILAASLAGFRVGGPVIMRERQGGVSSIHSFKSAYYMIKVSLALIIDRLSIRKVKRRPRMTAHLQLFMILGAIVLLLIIFCPLKARPYERKIQPALAGAGCRACHCRRLPPMWCMCCATCLTLRCRSTSSFC